ncbi:unnamed protein product [Lepeophtheirus salmonis]|uniref:(salmon louse) hypothetical protein n=1 Tax=Lepeophtheirus salmonis TaxID=72036 RepID=A0A7R8CNL7_LEPSM|nr:unnamed protein product [Lepeophtheirus salmonis]CAF2876382.1 unnamed protein product [Lepeophtheirus salmonis]
MDDVGGWRACIHFKYNVSCNILVCVYACRRRQTGISSGNDHGLFHVDLNEKDKAVSTFSNSTVQLEPMDAVTNIIPGPPLSDKADGIYKKSDDEEDEELIASDREYTIPLMLTDPRL